MFIGQNTSVIAQTRAIQLVIIAIKARQAQRLGRGIHTISTGRTKAMVNPMAFSKESIKLSLEFPSSRAPAPTKKQQTQPHGEYENKERD